MHSGHFGGAVANPINVLCQIISKVTDAEERITVPSFYDDVEEVPRAERDMIARIPFDEEKYKKAINVKALFGEKVYSTLERNSCRPSFDVCGGRRINRQEMRNIYPLPRTRTGRNRLCGLYRHQWRTKRTYLSLIHIYSTIILVFKLILFFCKNLKPR